MNEVWNDLKYEKYTKNNIKINKNYKNKSNKYEIYYMDIDVPSNMCQGVFTKNNKGFFCKNKSKYFINNRFHLCQLHRNQKIVNN